MCIGVFSTHWQVAFLPMRASRPFVPAPSLTNLYLYLPTYLSLPTYTPTASFLNIRGVLCVPTRLTPAPPFIRHLSSVQSIAGNPSRANILHQTRALSLSLSSGLARTCRRHAIILFWRYLNSFVTLPGENNTSR